MKQVATEAPKTQVMNKLIDFLSRSRKPIMIALGVVAVVVVTLVVVFSIQNSRTNAALTAAEDLQSAFEDWMEVGDETKAEEYGELAQAASQIIDAYPRTYAASRARMVDARALAELERWDEAATRYAEIADVFPESYLAPVSLMDAAVAAESGGDTDRTLELLTRLIDEYGENSAETPRALFSIGRIREQRDEVSDAADSYRRLIEGYPASSWTNLARNRIITLTVEGRIGG
ncbi:MAG: tetratricopeptide repeat protein [Spirochaetota bacterium]